MSTVSASLALPASGVPAGLSTAEANRRLEEFGRNEIRRERATAPLTLFLRQFASPVIWLLLILVVSIVYYAAPNIRQPFRLITPGAVIAVTAWLVASLGFAFYVQNFASYNKTYGSMGAVIVLLLYFFLSAAVMLFGAEVNAVHRRSLGERPQEASG